MTITEHLEFSVVSAPLAQIDRRALSQAWYSALCRSDALRKPACKEAEPPEGRTRISHSHQRNNTHEPQSRVHNPARKAASSAPSSKRPGEAEERRALRSPLARRIERRFLNPAQKPQQATFSLGGDAGRVQVLLKGAGTQMQLVAICAPSACAAVSAALAQARYALAVRGITLGTETRAARA